MKAFGRVFHYIWPQWPRVVVVVVSATLIAALLSVSFMTIIPLMKVMIGSEGLPGWAHRKSCEVRYGLRFYTPQLTELGTEVGQGSVYSLLVTDVVKDSEADRAGLRPADRIVAAEASEREPVDSNAPYIKLLETLAVTQTERVRLRVQRPQAQGAAHEMMITLATPYAVDAENRAAGGLRGIGRGVQLTLVGWLQGFVGLLPREQTPENRMRTITYIILALGLLTVIRCVARYFQDFLAQVIVQTGISQLREDVFAHITRMPVGVFASERPSDTVSRIVRDTQGIGEAVRIMLGKALREPLNVLFMILAAMVLNFRLTMIFLCGAPFVVIVLAAFGRKMKKATGRSLVASSELLSKLQETVAGLRVVKVYNRQEHEQAAFEGINRRLLGQVLKMCRVQAATRPLLELLGMLGGCAALLVGVRWVTSGHLDGPEFLAFLMLLGAAAEAVRKASDIWNYVQQADAAAARVFAVLDRSTETETPGAIELPAIRDQVEFHDVVFTYPGSKSPVLKGVNLTVTAGHNVAIVGPNGSGKTTLVNLLPRFYDPDSGQILIDGRDIREGTLASLRGQIGMVTQQVITFNDTVAANIAYGKPGATQDQIEIAAKGAFAHEFIVELPDGYRTIIGEHGTGLSGGQLQRIIIARAILNNPDILIFDEATSQVDADSEAKIHRAIEELMHERTTFIIAHRFSTVVAADVIVVIDDGRIIGQGQHEELMQTCPLYQGLYETQLVKA